MNVYPLHCENQEQFDLICNPFNQFSKHKLSWYLMIEKDELSSNYYPFVSKKKLTSAHSSIQIDNFLFDFFQKNAQWSAANPKPIRKIYKCRIQPSKNNALIEKFHDLYPNLNKHVSFKIEAIKKTKVPINNQSDLLILCKDGRIFTYSKLFEKITTSINIYIQTDRILKILFPHIQKIIDFKLYRQEVVGLLIIFLKRKKIVNKITDSPLLLELYKLADFIMHFKLKTVLLNRIKVFYLNDEFRYEEIISNILCLSSYHPNDIIIKWACDKFISLYNKKDYYNFGITLIRHKYIIEILKNDFFRIFNQKILFLDLIAWVKNIKEDHSINILTKKIDGSSIIDYIEFNLFNSEDIQEIIKENESEKICQRSLWDDMCQKIAATKQSKSI